LQGATLKNISIIAEIIHYEAEKHGSYDYQSIKCVNCYTSTYEKIQQMFFEEIEEDRVQIKILLKAYLLSLIKHKQGSYEYPEMKYRIGKAGHRRSGIFTDKGLVTLSGLTRNILKEESIPLPKDTDEKVLKRLLGLFFDGSSFIKFKAVGLVDVSSDDKIELTDMPNIVIATLKEGESVKDLSPVFKDRDLFEFVSLDGKKPRDQESIEEATDRGANQQGGTVKFPTPPNSVWTNVEMGIDYVDKMVITKVKGKHKKHTFSQVGISKRNSKGSDPTNLEAMLCKFADAENNVIYTGKISNVEYRKMISEQKRLNSILRKYFETIEGPPITRIEGEGFKVQFSKLYLIDTIREDYFREVATSELSDFPDSKSIS